MLEENNCLSKIHKIGSRNFDINDKIPFAEENNCLAVHGINSRNFEINDLFQCLVSKTNFVTEINYCNQRLVIAILKVS